jgi:hypothetical protein
VITEGLDVAFEFDMVRDQIELVVDDADILLELFGAGERLRCVGEASVETVGAFEPGVGYLDFLEDGVFLLVLELHGLVSLALEVDLELVHFDAGSTGRDCCRR